MTTMHRGFEIECNPKPIPPSFGQDWDWFFRDRLEGPDTPSWALGYAGSEAACREAIDEAIIDDWADREGVHRVDNVVSDGRCLALWGIVMLGDGR